MSRLFQKNDPHFSSGPTKKPYKISFINDAFCQNQNILGRSHRSDFWLERIQELMQEIRAKLNIPKDYKLALIAGSATGAMEALLWNLIGHKTVDIFSCDPFSEIWRHDIINELKIKKYNDYQEKPGISPPFHRYNPNHDCVFAYASTPSCTQVPDLNWIPDTRKGLTICDATAAAFGYDLDWKKLDATGFSFQKALGGEAGMGVIVLSKKAQKRLETFTAKDRPIPRLFNIKKYEKVFEGHVINTPSLLGLEDVKRCLHLLPDDYAKRVKDNFLVVKKWVNARKDLKFLAREMKTTSYIAPCIVVKSFSKFEDYVEIAKVLEKKGIAYDIVGHTAVPPCFRFWCGPFVKKEDLEKVVEVLDGLL